MKQYPVHRAMAVALILVTGLAGFTGCATGPVSRDDFAALLSGAQDVFGLFLAIRTELQALEAQPEPDRPDELARLEAEALRLWSTFERLRTLVNGYARTNAQKALVDADLYQGSMLAL